MKLAVKAHGTQLPAYPSDGVDELRRAYESALLDLEALQEPVPIFGEAPFVCIWDSHALPGAMECTQLRRIDFPPQGNPPVSARCVSTTADILSLLNFPVPEWLCQRHSGHVVSL
jgi:hypothetical protein